MSASDVSFNPVQITVLSTIRESILVLFPYLFSPFIFFSFMREAGFPRMLESRRPEVDKGKAWARSRRILGPLLTPFLNDKLDYAKSMS